jgi:4-hydroxy-3-methylbut-2-enyl diphosphate reductase
MEVIRAQRFAGFCGGVRRAWNIAQRAMAGEDGPVYVSGELIHNGPAMRVLEEKGVRVLPIMEQTAPVEGTVILRAHGEGPQVYARAAELGLNVIDATCGIVKAVQRKAVELEGRGFQVVLYGHKGHPEAVATLAHTRHGIIVDSVAEAEALPRFEKIAAIAQTTVLQAEYERVVEVLRTKCDVFEDHGEICAYTRKAQDEAVALAKQVDAVVVVGGRKSANTHRLVEVCSAWCPTYHVETADEIDPAWFPGTRKVGVCAGASTRDVDIEAVMKRLQELEPTPAKS